MCWLSKLSYPDPRQSFMDAIRISPDCLPKTGRKKGRLICCPDVFAVMSCDFSCMTMFLLCSFWNEITLSVETCFMFRPETSLMEEWTRRHFCQHSCSKFSFSGPPFVLFHEVHLKWLRRCASRSCREVNVICFTAGSAQLCGKCKRYVARMRLSCTWARHRDACSIVQREWGNGKNEVEKTKDVVKNAKRREAEQQLTPGKWCNENSPGETNMCSTLPSMSMVFCLESQKRLHILDKVRGCLRCSKSKSKQLQYGCRW